MITNQRMGGWKREAQNSGVDRETEESDLLCLECPRCGVKVSHQTNRPYTLWSIPALFSDGTHLIYEDGRVVDGKTCQGLKRDPWHHNLWIRMLRWMVR